MHVVHGTYCLAASTYEGDPRGLTSGPITLSPGAGTSSVVIAGSQSLTSGICAG
jgi:hypothetical protein